MNHQMSRSVRMLPANSPIPVARLSKPSLFIACALFLEEILFSHETSLAAFSLLHRYEYEQASASVRVAHQESQGECNRCNIEYHTLLTEFTLISQKNCITI